MSKTIWLSLLLLPLLLLTAAASGATPVVSTAAMAVEKVAEKAASPVAADYHGRHYLWSDNTFNAATFSAGTIELRADGGTFFANNYQAEFSWTLSEDQTLELQFDHFVENIGFEYINGAQVEVKFVLTSIQLQRTFTETDDSKQLHFNYARTGYKRYQGASLPDEPYPASAYPLKSTRTAGLLGPAQFIETGITALMPAVTTEVDTLVYDPILSWPNITYNRTAQRLRFDTVVGNSGTATLIKAKLQQDGTATDQHQPVNWQINADQTLTLLEQDGSQYQLTFLALSQANHPVLQVRYLPADPAKSVRIMQPAFWVKKNTPMSLSQLMANPVLELYQSAESRFWFEFHANGFGLQVNAFDRNNDQQFSDNEISQEPFRWQLLNGVLEFHRYRFSSLSGKSGICLPTTFNPAATSECISWSVRRYNVFDITPFNGIATAAIYNEQMLLATDRQPHWPATNILAGSGALDFRLLQMTASRPFPIKPLMAGVAIADDVLRQCILQHNPALPTDLTNLNCSGDVRQLAGLEKFTNLRWVSIRGSNRLSITGLAQLKQLPALTHLELSNLLIGDTEFATLAGMSPNSPIRLILNAIGLSDASYEVLDSMKISSIALGGPLTLMPVSRLPNDVTLAKLNDLHLTNLRLPNLLTELARLNNLANIEALGFVNMNMGTLNHLQLPPNVQSVIFAEDNIDTLDAAKLNPALLNTFHIYNASIQSVAFIEGLPNLEFLSLQRVTLTDWSPLTKPVPVSFLNAQFNSHVPCTVFNAIKTANPGMTVKYDACSSTNAHNYELNLPGGITATAVSFSDASDASKGELRIVAGKLEFIPAAGSSGWVEFTVIVTLSNGSTKSFSFRTYINKKSTRNKGLPWWVISAPNQG